MSGYQEDTASIVEKSAAIASIMESNNPEQISIAAVGLELVAMLLDKNRRYGSTATNPIAVFSKLDPIEGIRIRMDDKLSRIRTGAANDDEDPIVDLAGYCILHTVATRRAAAEEDELLKKAAAEIEMQREAEPEFEVKRFGPSYKND